MARADLERYRPSPTAEPDLTSFWERTLAEAARQPLDVQVESVEFPEIHEETALRSDALSDRRRRGS